MDIKKIEKISTSAGVVMLGALAIFGILGCLELVFDINFFVTARAADIWTVSHTFDYMRADILLFPCLNYA